MVAMLNTENRQTFKSNKNNILSFRNSTSAGPNGPRRMSGSMGRLHKKWRSTSDFEPPTPAPLSIYKKPGAGKGKQSILP